MVRTRDLITNYNPKVSVIIATLGEREEYLRNCLISVLEQSYQNFELIVVNDGSPPEKFEILVKDLEAKYNSKILLLHHKKRRSLTVSRNTGINVAKGEICAFLDDDCTAGKDWLKNIIQPYKDPKIGGVTTKIFLPHRKVYYEGYGLTYFFCPLPNAYSQEGEVDTICGANMSFRTKIIKKIGFDPNLGKTSMSEDHDISLSVRDEGYKLYYVPKALVSHFQAEGGCEPPKLSLGYAYLRNRVYIMLKYYKYFNRVQSIPRLTYFILRKHYRRCKESNENPFLILLGLFITLLGLPVGAFLYIKWKIKKA